MAKDLTQSRLDRQNILNNELAIQEIQETSVVEAVFFEDRLLMTCFGWNRGEGAHHNTSIF